MTTHQQYQHFQHQNQRIHQECLRQSSSSSNFSTSSVVQRLNNRACVLVSIGNFSKANQLFEIALSRHKQSVPDTSTSSMDANHESSHSRTNCTLDENWSATMEDAYDDFGDENFESSFDDDHYDNEDYDSGNPMSCNQHHQLKNDAIISSSVARASPSSSVGKVNHRQDNLHSTPMSPTGIRRMSSCSQLQTFSYSGQRFDRSPNKWVHHQIYSLPIVMDQAEWEMAPMEDRSFVLIFNSALCNHLLGMQLMACHQHQPATKATPAHQNPFEVAKMLYKLALEAFSNACPGQNSGRPLLGVDRLCYPAVFNNLSHVCKTLEGYNSYEAYQYDKLLLKSIYWLIDSTSSTTNSETPNPSPTSAGFSISDRGATTNGAESSSSASYAEDNAEIIDAFLENVFYLIGARQSNAPAAAA